MPAPSPFANSAAVAGVGAYGVDCGAAASDSAPLPVAVRAMRADVAGQVTVKDANGTSFTFNLVAGETFQMFVVHQVMATGTDSALKAANKLVGGV